MNKLPSPKNWNELDKLLWQCSWDPKTRKSNPYVAFRGLPEDYGNLRTTLQRLGYPRPQYNDIELASRERRLIDNFRMYAGEHVSLGPTDWDVLMLAQHYRLPTRLLDWTSSPYVALFFATANSDKLDRDGVVWCVLRKETNTTLPSPFDQILAEQQGYNLFYLDTLRKKFERLEAFDIESKDALIWFEPPSVSPRIVNQYAFFSVMPGVGTSLSDWLEKHPKWYWGVTVPAGLKHEVRERLPIMNITHRTMFPSLESITKWLKDYYDALP